MHFRLSYSGTPGEVSATLTDEAGKTVATATGLKNEKSARAWARAVGSELKDALTPLKSRAHSVYTTIGGHDHFNL